MTTIKLPEPSCPCGYTRADLETILGAALGSFDHWMRGQTQMICEATSYHHNRVHVDACGHTEGDEYDWQCDYDGGYYEPSPCADSPHGVVAYGSDLYRYLHWLPIID